MLPYTLLMLAAYWAQVIADFDVSIISVCRLYLNDSELFNTVSLNISVSFCHLDV
jgi:hypothetical protein